MKKKPTYGSMDTARDSMTHVARQRVPGLVSVIIPSFNKAAYILKALDSVRDQTYSDIELVVIDDASSDDSVDKIQSWLAANMVPSTFVIHRINHGLCRTLNEGLELANGEFVAALAADDYYLPHKIERHVQLLNDNSGAVFVYGDARIVDHRDELVSESYMKRYFGGGASTGRIFGELLQRDFIPALTATIRTSALDQVGNYDEDLPFEDYDMWLRLSLVGTVLYSESCDAVYREVPGSMTQTLGREKYVGHLRILSKYRNSGYVDPVVLEQIALREARNYAYMTSPQRGFRYAVALLQGAAIFGGASFVGTVAASVIRSSARRGLRRGERVHR